MRKAEPIATCDPSKTAFKMLYTGLAEAMPRSFPPGLVLIQACAHASPAGGRDWVLVNWLRAAAIIARIDTVRRGYLVTGMHGQPALPVTCRKHRAR